MPPQSGRKAVGVMSEGITITPLAYSPKDAAKYLGISLRSLWRIIADRKVTVRKLGHRTMIDAASLRAYYASLPTVEAAS
jgi:excisionase family DNA binding protein